MKFLVIAALMFLSSRSAIAQSAEEPTRSTTNITNVPDAASAKPPVITPRALTARSQHQFFDLKNALAASGFAVGLAGDSWSTQRALAYPGTKEANPVARPFVTSRTGQAVYSSGSLGFLVGGMYLAHRTGHHKLERAVPWALAGWEGFLTGWNIHQISRARRFAM
jgi:hypothetical protein